MKWNKGKITQSCPTVCDPMDWILQARILEWVAFPFSRDLPQPRSPALKADSLPAEPPGKPKNAGVGSLSLFQWIFLIREYEPGSLHSRQRFTLTSYVAAAKSLQSCPTLCDPIDGSPGGAPAPVFLQARILEWVAISLSNAEKWKLRVKSLSRARLLVTPWAAAYQTPLSMGFSRQGYWSGLPLPSPY